MTDRQTTPDPGVASPDDSASPAGAEKPYEKAARAWHEHKRVAFPTAVILAFLTIMITTGGNDPGFIRSTGQALASKVKSVTRPSPVPGTIGQSVRDGKFAFVVTSVEKRGTTITDRLGGTDTAQGEFVIVRVSVTNIGYEARTLTATDQFVVSNMGARFATSDEISGLRGAELIFREKVNPGSTVNDAPLLFDVPAGTTIAGVELHDSLTSTGVKVTIGKAPVRENELP